MKKNIFWLTVIKIPRSRCLFETLKTLHFYKHKWMLKEFKNKLKSIKCLSQVSGIHSRIKNRRIHSTTLPPKLAWLCHFASPLESFSKISHLSPYERSQTCSVCIMNAQRNKTEPWSWYIQWCPPFPNDTLKSVWSCNAIRRSVKLIFADCWWAVFIVCVWALALGCQKKNSIASDWKSKYSTAKCSYIGLQQESYSGHILWQYVS